VGKGQCEHDLKALVDREGHYMAWMLLDGMCESQWMHRTFSAASESYDDRTALKVAGVRPTLFRLLRSNRHRRFQPRGGIPVIADKNVGRRFKPQEAEISWGQRTERKPTARTYRMNCRETPTIHGK